MSDDEEDQKLAREIDEFLQAFEASSASSSEAPEPDDRITFEECCRIILEGWKLRQAGARPDTRAYNRQLLDLLTVEFDIIWRDDWTPRQMRSAGVPMVLPSMARRFADLAGPYSSFLEYASRPGEAEVQLRHRRRLQECGAAHRQAWVELFRDLMLLRWPEAAERCSTWSRLRALGLGEQPERSFL
ncbi:hypothetical protein [Teichococcus oryzae]|uniref:Uncharacterized protein n=1 Tax=Teichococcus oryzae TaxID=1608942 RepID=A0A5B2TC21_9PROT|nr:hypothetical protein [Pseudoroseomonas oryzae]KAA2211360.1 hypothetical protein F0Q34_20465 [Pseudoroseomonas oryzae]